MADHRRSHRFYGDDFEMSILEESLDRSLIESLEEQYIIKYDTFSNGLNATQCGKGSGHNSTKFTTIGYIFSKESREKMSHSAIERAKHDHQERVIRSQNLWKDPNYRKTQEGKRKGRRLRPPILSDEQVSEIRYLFKTEKDKITRLVESINIERKRKGHFLTTPERYFANMYCQQYNVSLTLIRNIVCNTMRTQCLPPAYKS